jgi:hypothetical protein
MDAGVKKADAASGRRSPRLVASLILVALTTNGCRSPGPPNDPTRVGDLAARAQAAIDLGGAWFLAHARKRGFVHYKYLPNKGRHALDNNYLRRLGGLWCVAALAQFTGDERFAHFATHGIAYFEEFATTTPRGGRYLVIGGDAKLGYPAFMILALIEMPWLLEGERLLDAYGEGLLSQQRADGSYATHFGSTRATGVDYYPGEANLALMALYEHGGARRHLAAVERSFPYYRAHWRAHPTLAFIPWQTQAFARLFHATRAAPVRDFVYEMTEALLREQQTPARHARRAYVGGFTFPTPGISTASYLEGLVDAYLLARDEGDAPRAARYATATRLAIAYILSLQYRDDNRFGLAKLDDKVRGGFRQSTDNSNLRVDNNQHAVMALMKVSRSGVLEDGAAPKEPAR